MNFQSNDLFSKEHTSSEKFDYFVCGIGGALFAYLGQAYIPQKFESWSQCLTPLALICLTLSFYSGFRRIQISNELTKLNKEMLQAHERIVNFTSALNTNDSSFVSGTGEIHTREMLEQFRKDEEKMVEETNKLAFTKTDLANRCGKFRDGLLFIGFLAILFSKIVQPYFEK